MGIYFNWYFLLVKQYKKEKRNKYINIFKKKYVKRKNKKINEKENTNKTKITKKK